MSIFSLFFPNQIDFHSWLSKNLCYSSRIQRYQALIFGITIEVLWRRRNEFIFENALIIYFLSKPSCNVVMRFVGIISLEKQAKLHMLCPSMVLTLNISMTFHCINGIYAFLCITLIIDIAEFLSQVFYVVIYAYVQASFPS